MEFVTRLAAIIIAVFSSQKPMTDADQVRLQAVAQDIWQVSSSPIFGGEDQDARRATALALVAVATHESAYWADVQDCSLCYPGSAWCDRGRSVTLFQLQGKMAWGPYTREELCKDNRKATERARHVLSRFTKSRSPLELFDGYASGGLRMRPSRAARQLASGHASLLSKEGLMITYKDGRLSAVPIRRGP